MENASALHLRFPVPFAALWGFVGKPYLVITSRLPVIEAQSQETPLFGRGGDFYLADCLRQCLRL